jgi:hypothetical protein
MNSSNTLRRKRETSCIKNPKRASQFSSWAAGALADRLLGLAVVGVMTKKMGWKMTKMT